MRITITQYAEYINKSAQSVGWRLRYNAKHKLPLNHKMQDIVRVYKLGRSYELEFDGIWISSRNGKKLKSNA